MAPQFILAFLNSLSLFQSKLYSLFEQVGSLSIIFLASSRASCTNCPSRAISAIFKSNAIPLCCVPSRSPGPRSFKSVFCYFKTIVCIAHNINSSSCFSSKFMIGYQYTETFVQHLCPLSLVIGVVAIVQSVEHLK